MTRLSIIRLQRRYAMTVAQTRLVADLHYGGACNV
jgi:hypothetical protein